MLNQVQVNNVGVAEYGHTTKISQTDYTMGSMTAGSDSQYLIVTNTDFVHNAKHALVYIERYVASGPRPIFNFGLVKLPGKVTLSEMQPMTYCMSVTNSSIIVLTIIRTGSGSSEKIEFELNEIRCYDDTSPYGIIYMNITGTYRLFYKQVD